MREGGRGRWRRRRGGSRTRTSAESRGVLMRIVSGSATGDELQ